MLPKYAKLALSRTVYCLLLYGMRCVTYTGCISNCITLGMLCFFRMLCAGNIYCYVPVAPHCGWWVNTIDRRVPPALLDVLFSNRRDGQNVLNVVFSFNCYEVYMVYKRLKRSFSIAHWRCNILYRINKFQNHI